MVLKLLTEETLVKILKSAKETSVMFNEKINALSKEDNENLVRVAYDRLELLILPIKDIENRPADFDGKQFLVDGMKAYFEIISQAKDEGGKPLSDIFLGQQDKFKGFLEPLMPEGYTIEQGCTTFAPQLMIYISYLLWKYDQSLEGKLVSDYFNEFQQRRVCLEDKRFTFCDFICFNTNL